MPAGDALTSEQVEAFDRDGFVIVEEGLVPEAALEPLRERFLQLFDGTYETGVKPDEVNWIRGRDPEDRTRQICNGWKSDTVVAAQVLSERTGRLTAQLARYGGVRLLQDNVLWKPPGTKAIGFHQDASYADYLVPPEMITCWISLHDLPADAGPVEYVRGSHLWPRTPPRAVAVPRPRGLARARSRSGAGGAGARRRAGRGEGRRRLVPPRADVARLTAEHDRGNVPYGARLAHAARSRCASTRRNVDLIYSRYRRRGDLVARRVVLPRDVGRDRLSHTLARRASRSRLTTSPGSACCGEPLAQCLAQNRGLSPMCDNSAPVRPQADAAPSG